MVSGTAVAVKIWEYAAASMKLQTKEEIFSAMAVYRFLTYKDGRVRIPNKELMSQFTAILRKEAFLRN